MFSCCFVYFHACFTWYLKKMYPSVLSLFQKNFVQQILLLLIVFWSQCQACLTEIFLCLIAFSLTYAIRFPLRQRNGSNGDCDTIEITVYDYYAKKGIDLKYSGDFPCINTGRAKRPTYFPIEVCFIYVSVHPIKSLFIKYILHLIFLYCVTSYAPLFRFKDTPKLCLRYKGHPLLRSLDRSLKKGWQF